MCCRANKTRCNISWLFHCKVMAEWLWRYKSSSNVIMHNTPSYASAHLCIIWKKSIQNYRHHWAGMAYRRDRWMDGWTDGWSATIITPNNLVVCVCVCGGCGGGGEGCYKYHKSCMHEIREIISHGKSREFDNCNRPSNLGQTGSMLLTFWMVWQWNLMDDLKKGNLFLSTRCYVCHLIAIP